MTGGEKVGSASLEQVFNNPFVKLVLGALVSLAAVFWTTTLGDIKQQQFLQTQAVATLQAGFSEFRTLTDVRVNDLAESTKGLETRLNRLESEILRRQSVWDAWAARYEKDTQDYYRRVERRQRK